MVIGTSFIRLVCNIIGFSIACAFTFNEFFYTVVVIIAIFGITSTTRFLYIDRPK
jgi:hypothetical protein